jgi:hypothetical protein
MQVQDRFGAITCRKNMCRDTETGMFQKAFKNIDCTEKNIFFVDLNFLEC